MTINERIKQLRLDLGLSQARFAQDISVSAGYIASIELGNRRVNDRIIKLICTQYNIRSLPSFSVLSCPSLTPSGRD